MLLIEYLREKIGAFKYTTYNNEIQSNQMKAESKVWTCLWSFVFNWFMFGLDGMNWSSFCLSYTHARRYFKWDLVNIIVLESAYWMDINGPENRIRFRPSFTIETNNCTQRKTKKRASVGLKSECLELKIINIRLESNLKIDIMPLNWSGMGGTRSPAKMNVNS